jgi:glycosyltransferase involved in cell wall biosynthesis
MEPLVSIWMAAYNAAQTISKSIESVLAQSYKNFELIIVDDGSTDNTADIVRSFEHESIKYFLKTNGGLASARNVQIKQSSGTFVVILDSDDMMTPDFLSQHLQAFEQYPEADIIYCDDLFIDENDKPVRILNRPEYHDNNRLISELFRCGYPVVPFRTCIRKKVFDKIGGYDERLVVYEDYDILMRFAQHGLKMHHLPGLFYLRRTTMNRLSRSFNAVNARCHFDIVRRFAETFTPEQLFPDVQWDKLPPEQKTLLAKCKTAIVYFGIGERYVDNCAPDGAQIAFDMACELLDDCCKIEPANQQVINLREQFLTIREKHLPSGSGKNYQPVRKNA